MNEFWVASGHLLLDRSADGLLLVTDDFLRLYLARPELMPPPEACAAERALHARLMADPRATADTAALADPDARENWDFFLALRQALLAAPSLEAAYLALVREGAARLPPLIFAQLTHVVLRNALHGTEDALAARAGELFWRPQRVTRHEGRVLLADSEAIAGHEEHRRHSPLLAMLGGPAAGELEVLTADNAPGYWARSDAHDLVLDLAAARPALATVLAAWLRHLTGIEAAITPIERIETQDWAWFVGLDAEATRIGNALWQGEAAPEADSLLALFRLTLPVGLTTVDGPVTLLLAAAPDGTVRMKPQNLLVGLPLAAQA